MIDVLLKIDSFLFYFINSTLSNPIFDIIFVPFHKPQEQWILIFFVLLVLISYIYKYSKKALLVIIFLIFGIIITDQIGRAIKNLELRKRPYITEEYVNISNKIDIKKDQNNNYKETESSRKSFPSNHSANIFFISFFLYYIYPNKKKYFIALALLVSISRVYVGVHYPADIIAGAILGIIISYLIIKILNKLGFNLATYHQEA